MNRLRVSILQMDIAWENKQDNLRRLREKFGLSQEKLCAELQCRNCDIGRSTYAKYENGELNIRISVLMELKKIYNCSYEDFWKPGKSEWDSEILDITNKQRDLPEMGGSFLHAKKESGASPLSFGNP